MFICGGFHNTMWRNATSFFLIAIRHICKYFILLSQNNYCNMKHIPQYLFSKRFLYMTVLYITIFSVIFMNIYTPFSTTAWFNLQDKSLIMATIMFYTLAVLFLLFSKSILHDISRKVSFSTFGLLLYYLVETAILALLYTLFTTIPNQVVSSNSLIDIYFKSAACIGMILIIPYTIFHLYGL